MKYFVKLYVEHHVSQKTASQKKKKNAAPEGSVGGPETSTIRVERAGFSS